MSFVLRATRHLAIRVNREKCHFPSAGPLCATKRVSASPSDTSTRRARTQTITCAGVRIASHNRCVERASIVTRAQSTNRTLGMRTNRRSCFIPAEISIYAILVAYMTLCKCLTEWGTWASSRTRHEATRSFLFRGGPRCCLRRCARINVSNAFQKTVVTRMRRRIEVGWCRCSRDDLVGSGYFTTVMSMRASARPKAFMHCR